jgi:hypothetical protein
VIRHIEFGDSTGAGAIDFNSHDNSFNILGGGGYGKPIYGGYSTHLYTTIFGRMAGSAAMRFDDLTALKWGQCPDTTGGSNGLFSIVSDINKDVYSSLPFTRTVRFQNFSATTPVNQFRDLIVKLSKNNGTLLSHLPDLNTTIVNSSSNFAAYQNLLINETGNLYATGNMTSNNVVAGMDTAFYYGGQNDMFIIKYGNNCSNTSSLITAAAPIEVNAKCNTNAIQINWKDISTTEDKYYIYRSLTATSGFSKIDSVAANTTQYLDNTVSSGTNYWYAVSAHNNMGEGYLSTADSSMLCGVGIDDATMNNVKLVVYPNPVSNVLICKCANMLINTIEIHNVLGQNVLAVTPSPLERAGVRSMGDVSMDVSKLSSGVYFIKTTDKNGNVMNGKFVKE